MVSLEMLVLLVSSSVTASKWSGNNPESSSSVTLFNRGAPKKAAKTTTDTLDSDKSSATPIM